MRPLLRNVLWLAFASACGVAGAWYGLRRGSEIIATLAGENLRANAFADIQRGLPIIAGDPDSALAQYADSNLRAALRQLGAYSYTEARVACSPRDRAQLARVAAWLEKRPEPASAASDPLVVRGLALCKR